MIKILADNKIPFLKGVLEPFANISYHAGADITSSLAKDADALITRTRTKCNSELLRDSQIKIITTATIGYDHIDTDFCAKNNIKWINAPGCNAESVKQYIAAVLATLIQKTGETLRNKTIGIIGVGNVGRKIKDLAEGIGMTVLLNDPPRAEKEGNNDFTDIKTIQEKADIITFHVPLFHDGKYKTEHMADADFLSHCKKGSVIINASRGEVVNNYDLSQQLSSKHISNAIIDVWENEPTPNPDLLKQVLIGTSHIAGYSVDGKAKGTAQSVQNISKYFHLGLDEWYPTELPQAENNIIKLDAAKYNIDELWMKAVIHTYPIHIDNSLLKNKTSEFENHRGNYMIRREFASYTIKIKNGNADNVNNLNKIGFSNVELV